VVTLGVYGPIWVNRMHRVFMNRTGLGTQLFQYHGSDKIAFRLGIKGFFLSLVTFGIYYFWYSAALARWRAQNTWFGGAHGELTLEGADLFVLSLLQVLGVTLSLGLAFPWVTTYMLRFTLQRMRFVGPIDFEHIYPAPSQGDAAADGLANALDLGAAL
jgi:uncharacterized membrane protein YjgN (DUF898 family)